MAKTNEKKQQAQSLYMAGNKTQKEIANIVGVNERSVYSWIHKYAWDKLRLAAFQAPVTIADNLAAQIVELQNVIVAREVGNRFPNPQEAEVSRKLIASWDRMKKHPSLSVHMQVLETFRNYIRPIDSGFARELGKYTRDFIEAKSLNGYAPYQVEYGVDAVSPIMPDYDEVEGLDANKTEYVPCPDHLTCLYPGKCNYPYCMKEKPRDITVDDYKVSPVLFTRNNPQKNDIAAEATGSNSVVATSETGEKTNNENQLKPVTSRNSPASFLSQNLGLNESSPLGAEGFNRDRFMVLLEKLITNSQLQTLSAEVTGSNSVVFTSEDSKNNSAINPQNENENNRAA